MQNFINPIYNYNVNFVQKIKKQNNISTSPIKNSLRQNISFKGTEALAAYNYSLVNKDELFNLPVIKPLDIPIKVEDIKGEKIYNSNGDLVRIVSSDNNKPTTYYFKDNKLSYSITKEQNITWEMYFENGEIGGVDKKLPDGTEYSTDYENGKPVQVSKYKMFSKDNEIEIDYLPNKKTYSIRKSYTENGKYYSSYATYDKDKKCIEAFESEGMHNECTDLYFIDGKPYNTTTSKSTPVDKNAGKDDIDLTNLEPAPFYHIDMDKINAIEGERKYYSNGKLEKIISKEGDIYNFEPEGILSTIESKNKKIDFGYQYGDDKTNGHSIIETMSDGGIKRTQYKNSPNESFSVFYENADIEKDITYDDNGNISSYYNKQSGQKTIDRYYDENGNLIRCWDDMEEENEENS